MSSFIYTGAEGKKTSFCSLLYNEVIVDDERTMNIWHIVICILSLFFTIFAYLIFRHNQNISTKNNRINKNAILPLYSKLLLFYIMSIIFTLIVWILEYEFVDCFNLNSKYWWLSILCSFQTSIKRFFELFISLFISRKSSGKIAIKQSILRSLIIAFLLFIIYFFMYSAHYINYPFSTEIFYIVSESIYFSLLLLILWYCCCHHWLRMSNIYILLICTLLLEILYIISWIMIRSGYDGYCLNDIGDLLQIIIFPILIIYIIRADSYFWRTIFDTLSQSTRITKNFGANKSTKQLSARLSNDSFGYTPITDFLSMQVTIIDFASLKIGSNPVGHGSTSMVYPALLNRSQLVAVKVFTLDEITIKSIADFFRETLLSADINHPNVVKFIGCCIRPPEICLVYEICSHGDLASFIFCQNKTLLEYSTYNSTLFGPTMNPIMNGLFETPTNNQYNFDNDPSADLLQFESTDPGHGGSGGSEQRGIPGIDDIKLPHNDNKDIIYRPPTILSDNTTIPSNEIHKKKTSNTATTITIINKPFGSPTEESSINTNKYLTDRPHEEIINSLKAKMRGTGGSEPGTSSEINESVSAASIILSLSARLALLLDISKGMAFLHKKNILHRDLKTSNILVHFESEQGRFMAKVCDFGSSRYAYSTMNDSESKNNGTKSRELSLTNYKNANKYIKKAGAAKKKVSKRIPQILANVRKLKLDKNSRAIRSKNVLQNPFHYRTASITEDSAFEEEPSCSMTTTSTRFGIDDTATHDGHTYGTADNTTRSATKIWRDKHGLLPEPIRNLSTVAYTAPENLNHIDFSGYERLHGLSSKIANIKKSELKKKRVREKEKEKEKEVINSGQYMYYNQKKKKFTNKVGDGVDVTPQCGLRGHGISMSLDNEDSQLSMASEPIEMNEDGMTKDRSMLRNTMSHGQSMDDIDNIGANTDNINNINNINNISIMNVADIDLKTAFKADVFSFAVIIWEIICMKPIYEDMNLLQIRDMILSGNRIKLINFDDLVYISNYKIKREKERKRYRKIQQLMSDCWQQNAKLRPDFIEIGKIINDCITDK